LDETPLKISPRARRVAHELGIALSELAALGKPTIQEEDVRALFSRRGTAVAVEEAVLPGDAEPVVTPLSASEMAGTGNESPPVEEAETAPDDFEVLAEGAVELAPREGDEPDGSSPPAEPERPSLGERAIHGSPATREMALSAQHPSPAPAATAEIVPITPIRRIIAERALLSAREVPQFSLWLDVAIGAVFTASEAPLWATAVWVAAVARTLRTHPRLNASYSPEGVRLHPAVHVGVALPLEDGLVVPVLQDADRKSLEELSEELRDREDRAQTRRLRGEHLAGATFTLSDWSAFGIRGGVPLIHPPQAATLGIGAPRDVPMLADGGLLFRRASEIVLVADQRAVDTAHAAAFLTALKQEVEAMEA
jgi:pyruvate dehydrogenase E2 component (dihydrolipoamide acetyltransferase)